MVRRLVTSLRAFTVCAVLLAAATPCAAQAPDGERQNMRLVGTNDLQARSAYQPVIHQQVDRWLAFIGHHGGCRQNPLTGREEVNGTSIVDVTDPRRPQYLQHIPGAPGEAEAGGAAMVRVCDGKGLPKGDPAKTYFLRTLGNLAHEIWDVSDPRRPSLVTTVVTGLNGTHKNWWECDTGIAYLVSDGRPRGWRTNRMTKIFDLGDPGHPRFIRDFGLPGQEPGSSGAEAPEGVHGPNALKNRVPEFAGNARGAVRDIVVLVSESLANECQEARQLTFLVDFNAGVRAVDIRDPFRPREIDFFIPATTANTDTRCVLGAGVERCKVAIQTNNVEVDDRGFIYLVDRANTGLHIVEMISRP